MLQSCYHPGVVVLAKVAVVDVVLKLLIWHHYYHPPKVLLNVKAIGHNPSIPSRACYLVVQQSLHKQMLKAENDLKNYYYSI